MASLLKSSDRSHTNRNRDGHEILNNSKSQTSEPSNTKIWEFEQSPSQENKHQHRNKLERPKSEVDVSDSSLTLFEAETNSREGVASTNITYGIDPSGSSKPKSAKQKEQSTCRNHRGTRSKLKSREQIREY